MNRVQKFQTKWKKFEADRHALASAVIAKRDEIPGVHELQNEGGLKEAAAVFTEEGLQTFAQLFANTVESAIQNHLSQAIEAAVEKKMTEVFEIATAKIRMVTEQIGSAVWNSVATAQEEKSLMNDYIQENEYGETIQQIADNQAGKANPVNQILRDPMSQVSINQISVNQASQMNGKLTQAVTVELQKPVVKQKKRYTIEQQSKIVAEYLRDFGKQRVCDLAKNVEGVFWSSNPWIKISQFCKVNPHIRKYKGYYEYVEHPEERNVATHSFGEMGNKKEIHGGLGISK